MNFSTALRLNDVDDYIAPSASCIKPVKIVPSISRTTTIIIGDNGSYIGKNDKGEQFTLSKAKMDLNDCLACSGCITTAETVMLSQHSTQTFLDILYSNRQKIIKDTEKKSINVILSPQSIANLHAVLQHSSENHSLFISAVKKFLVNYHKALNPQSVYDFCCDLLVRNGVERVLDLTIGRDLSLLKSSEEFTSLWSQLKSGSTNSYLRFPIMTGICPGWVCYAEKSYFNTTAKNSMINQSFLLDHISKVRSPQQLLAGILKKSVQNNLFTTFVMPCYDKKLEASRIEFEIQNESDASKNLKETDLVLGTNEFMHILEVLIADNFSTSAISSKTFHSTCKIENAFRMSENERQIYRHPGSGSGGYASSVLHYAAYALFDIRLNLDITQDDRILIRNLGNNDLQEISLFKSSDVCKAVENLCLSNRTPYRHGGFTHQPLLCFAVANGFRNIQTVVQLLKRFHSKNSNAKQSSKCFPFDYIEIMACPGGCLNGGAQSKDTDLSMVKSSYFGLNQRAMMDSPVSQNLLHALNSEPTFNAYTTYRSIPKINIINPSSLKW